MEGDMVFLCSLVTRLSQFRLSFQFLAQSEKKNLEEEIVRALLSPGFYILSGPVTGTTPDV